MADIIELIRSQFANEAFRVTAHAQAEMVEEEIELEDVLQCLVSGQALENYPEHRRGACCLIGGRDKKGRPVHVVCATANPLLIVITVYTPKPPKWPTPEKRGVNS